MAEEKKIQREVSGLTPSAFALARRRTLPGWTYFSERELARCLGMPEFHPFHLRMAGVGPKYLRFGRKVLYQRKDVEAWIEANVSNGTSRTRGRHGKR